MSRHGSLRFFLPDAGMDFGTAESLANQAKPTATTCLQKLPSAACRQVQSKVRSPSSSRSSTLYISEPSTLAVTLVSVTRRLPTASVEKYSSPRRKIAFPARSLRIERVIKSSSIGVLKFYKLGR